MRAIADAEKDIGGDLKKDRNLDDNLRVYNDQLAALTGNYAAYDALMPRLIAAWPDDYVYASRWGKSLLARGKPAEALPQLEKAAEQRSEEHTSEIQSLMRNSSAVFCLKKKRKHNNI